ncbi:MAG: diaminopimelate epimerase, partial [Clostridia bacterium]
MKFTKMQAYGNDYVYIETLTQTVENPSALARFVSKQHFGIGSDGMILICQSQIADFRMRVFNPDGSEAEMCGNATRSVGKFVYSKGFTNKTEITLETIGGIKLITLFVKNGNVVNISANIGAPIFDVSKIPSTLSNGDNKLINYHVKIIDRDFVITAISLGNPHCGVYCENVFDDFDIEKYGPFIENLEIFPKKANVEFYEVIDKNTLHLRTWERNCGETLACATGCCVSTVSAYLLGKSDSSCNVVQRGGIIKIDYNTQRNELVMTGKSEFVFDGFLD